MQNKKQYLKTMGIDLWQDKTKTEEAKPITKSSPSVLIGDPGIKNLNDLKAEVLKCNLCDLYKTRNNVVFGAGNENAKIMFIGEAPGANEDLQGEPFVGRAGILLHAMIRSIGLERKDVYIANILKCRPPNNRDPLPKEIKLCTPYLQEQINIIKPKILIAVGRIAAQHLLNTTESMAHLRGKTYQYGTKNTPLMVTYHPAYLLRSPSEKRKAYQDFLMIKEAL